jgi:glyoxylase-like metal-dependent hydrolase (beta-lactamase superfamily II)
VRTPVGRCRQGLACLRGLRAAVPAQISAGVGLGNSAYLLDLGDGRALAVDASRDLRATYGKAEAPAPAHRYAAETHLHADFISGARQLAADHDTQILASIAGKREFPHIGLADADEIDLGGLTLRALATPGHTAEHLSYLILDGSNEVGVFTGGSLIVGAAARTDLVDSERTVEFARAWVSPALRSGRVREN